MRESKIRSIFSRNADASFTSPRRRCSSANRRSSPTTSPRPRRYAVSVKPRSRGLGRGSCSKIAWTRNASPASCIAFSTVPVWYRSGWSFRRLRSFRISSCVSWSAVPTSCPRCIAWIALPLSRAIVRDDLIVSSRTSSFSSNRPSISEMTSSRFFTSCGWPIPLFEGWPADASTATGLLCNLEVEHRRLHGRHQLDPYRHDHFDPAGGRDVPQVDHALPTEAPEDLGHLCLGAGVIAAHKYIMVAFCHQGRIDHDHVRHRVQGLDDLRLGEGPLNLLAERI